MDVNVTRPVFTDEMLQGRTEGDRVQRRALPLGDLRADILDSWRSPMENTGYRRRCSQYQIEGFS